MDINEESDDVVRRNLEASSIARSAAAREALHATIRNSAPPGTSTHNGSREGDPSSPPQLRAKAVGFDLRHPASDSSTATTVSTLTKEAIASSFAAALNPPASTSNDLAPSTSNVDVAVPPSTSSSSSIVGYASSNAAPMASSANAPAATSSSSALPSIGTSIPMSSNCVHTLEEGQDKKFQPTKLGPKITLKNVTLAQYFALVWSNPEYNDILSSHFTYSEWNSPLWKPHESGCCITRFVTYRMPLSIPMGPKSTRQESTQNARLKDANTLLIETCNISKDVPLSDAFEVREKWVICQVGTDITIEASGCVVWKKAAWGLKGAITSRSIEGVIENYAYVTKVMESLVNKWTSASTGNLNEPKDTEPTASSSTQPATLNDSKRSSSSKKKSTAQDNNEDDSDSSDNETKPSQKRRPSRRPKGSRDLSSDANISSGGSSTQYPQTGFGSFLGEWRGIVFVLLAILAVATLATVFLSMANMTSRLSQLESSKHTSHHTISHEERNLRERVAFLEHLTTALLHNISDPGSYKSEQQKYWYSIRELDQFLHKTGENVEKLRTVIHLAEDDQTHNPDGSSTSSTGREPLTTGQVIEALKTLPIDRKILGYLMNPDSFAKQLSHVLSPDGSSSHDPQQHSHSHHHHHQTHSTDTLSSFSILSFWPVYFGSAVCVLALVVFGVAKSLGY